MTIGNLDAVHAMMHEISQSDSVFFPSGYWDDLNKQNLDMLEAGGLENFKRTLSQNYFNWLVTSPRHPLFRHALKEWCFHPDAMPFTTNLAEADGLKVTTGTGPLALTLSALRLDFYRLYVCFVWGIMCRHDHHRLHDLLREPQVGNPFRVMHGQHLLSQDLASSILECNILADLTAGVSRPRIAEVGAGYGRLAYAYAQSQPGQYYVFDIPPALAVAQWYLEQTLGGERLFKFRHFERLTDVASEIESASVVMLTPNQMRKFPDRYFDVALSISTLPEMRQDQVDLYLREFQRLSRGHIFLKQWKTWKNPTDGTDLTPESYRFAPQWRVTLDRTDPVVPTFFNRIWSLTWDLPSSRAPRVPSRETLPRGTALHRTQLPTTKARSRCRAQIPASCGPLHRLSDPSSPRPRVRSDCGARRDRAAVSAPQRSA
jgi:hypothetical protein